MEKIATEHTSSLPTLESSIIFLTLHHWTLEVKMLLHEQFLHSLLYGQESKEMPINEFISLDSHQKFSHTIH